jgi:hypothetical protein
VQTEVSSIYHSLYRTNVTNAQSQPSNVTQGTDIQTAFKLRSEEVEEDIKVPPAINGPLDLDVGHL